MEVFRSLGGDLAAQIVQRSPPLDHWRSFVYCESVTGRLLGSVDHFPVRLGTGRGARRALRTTDATMLHTRACSTLFRWAFETKRILPATFLRAE